MEALPTLEEFRKKYPFDPHDDLRLNYPNQLKTCEDPQCVELKCVSARVADSLLEQPCAPNAKTSNAPELCEAATGSKKT